VKRRPWDPARADAARLLRAGGWSPAAISRLLAVDVERVCQWLHNPHRASGNAKRNLSLAHALRSAGWPNAHIAKHLRLSPDAVRSLLATKPRTHAKGPAYARRRAQALAETVISLGAHRLARSLADADDSELGAALARDAHNFVAALPLLPPEAGARAQAVLARVRERVGDRAVAECMAASALRAGSRP
jgi:hypothetical protein